MQSLIRLEEYDRALVWCEQCLHEALERYAPPESAVDNNKELNKSTGERVSNIDMDM